VEGLILYGEVVLILFVDDTRLHFLLFVCWMVGNADGFLQDKDS
jgi:hypothetical protein